MFGLTVPRPRLEHWPEGTAISDTDIVVAGISLRRLAEVCGTPTSHSAASVIPLGSSLPSPESSTGVLVTRVLQVAEHYSGVPLIRVDAPLRSLRLVWSEARVIGAKTGSRSKLSLLVREKGVRDIEATHKVLAVDLPARVAVGDLIAIPSRSISSGPDHPLHPVTGRAEWRPDSVSEDVNLTRTDWWETID